jgi:hypothetical protein
MAKQGTPADRLGAVTGSLYKTESKLFLKRMDKKLFDPQYPTFTDFEIRRWYTLCIGTGGSDISPVRLNAFKEHVHKNRDNSIFYYQ